MAIDVNAAEFESKVLKSSTLVLVDFWATWCKPCSMLMPIIEDISREYDSKMLVCKVNVDENQDISSKHNVMSIPTVLLFKDGSVVEQFIGVQARNVYTDAINKHI